MCQVNDKRVQMCVDIHLCWLSDWQWLLTDCWACSCFCADTQPPQRGPHSLPSAGTSRRHCSRTCKLTSAPETEAAWTWLGRPHPMRPRHVKSF